MSATQTNEFLILASECDLIFARLSAAELIGLEACYRQAVAIKTPATYYITPELKAALERAKQELSTEI
jgi:hypothetical protein